MFQGIYPKNSSSRQSATGSTGSFRAHGPQGQWEFEPCMSIARYGVCVGGGGRGGVCRCLCVMILWVVGVGNA